jgi:hypothetical protein
LVSDDAPVMIATFSLIIRTIAHASGAALAILRDLFYSDRC